VVYGEAILKGKVAETFKSNTSPDSPAMAITLSWVGGRDRCIRAAPLSFCENAIPFPAYPCIEKPRPLLVSAPPSAQQKEIFEAVRDRLFMG